jgi:hypothetical protein
MNKKDKINKELLTKINKAERQLKKAIKDRIDLDKDISLNRRIDKMKRVELLELISKNLKELNEIKK